MPNTAARAIEVRTLPGPKGLPLLGNLLQLGSKRLHLVLEGWANIYGPLYRLQLGRKAVAVISDPMLINQILRERPEGFRRLTAIETIQNELGIGGVFSAEGEVWRRQRRMVNQAFNTRHLQNFFPTLDSITEKLMRRLKNHADRQNAVDIQHDLMRFTVDVTTNLAFGYDVNTLESEGDVIQRHLEKIFPMLARRINAPFPYWRYIRLPSDRALERALVEIRKAVDAFVAHSRAKIAKDPALEEHPGNLLEAMLVAKDDHEQRFADREIRGNVLTILLAGEDTTANTLAWMIHFMIEYPQVQQAMQGEADSVLGANRYLRDYARHNELETIEAVAFETMRLKSVAPLLFLDSNRDQSIGGIHIPQGSTVFLLSRQCALQESAFGEAHRFMPERWLDNQRDLNLAHDASACLPFGAGPRFCPGRALAMLEIKTAMAMMCRNFTFSKRPDCPPVEEAFEFVMVPKNLQVEIQHRSAP